MDATAIDVSRLPGPAQKILDPAGPPPLKAMAAKGLVPGLKPGDVLAVIIVLATGTDAHAQAAQKTLDAVPAPLFNGALAQADLQPGVLDALAPKYAADIANAERILNHPNIHAGTVARLAEHADEMVCEMVATNEERMISNPIIIEKLYLNKNCRMSTASRILELAVRNDLELAIPAFAQAKVAIQGELIGEPTQERSFDDDQFDEAKHLAEQLRLAEDEDLLRLDESTGKEVIVDKAKPLHAIWANMTAPSKIRLLTIGTIKHYDKDGKLVEEQRLDPKTLRKLGVADANPQVAVAALETPGINEGEVAKFASSRNVCEDVLRKISMTPDWTQSYAIKKALVMNPRTPFGQASKFVMHMRETDLKAISKSREVSGAIQTAAKQQLSRKGK